MGTNVNTPFFQVPTPEFGHGARARVQGLKVQGLLYSGTELGNDISGTQCLNTAPFCAGARVLVLGLQVWTQSYSEQAGQTGIFVNMYSVVSQICPVKSVKALVLCTAVLDLCKNLVKKTLRTSQPVLTNGKRPKFWLCPMKQNPKWNILMMEFKIWLNYTLCTSRKYQYSPHRRDWNFLGDGGFCKAKKMYEA